MASPTVILPAPSLPRSIPEAACLRLLEEENSLPFMDTQPDTLHAKSVDDLIDRLIQSSGNTADADLIVEIIRTALKMARDGSSPRRSQDPECFSQGTPLRLQGIRPLPKSPKSQHIWVGENSGQFARVFASSGICLPNDGRGIHGHHGGRSRYHGGCQRGRGKRDEFRG